MENGTAYTATVWTETDNLNLYAKWGVGVTFNYGVADNAPSDVVAVTVYEGEAWSFTVAEPVKAGYAFAGWYNGDVKVELSGEAWAYDETVTLTATVTLLPMPCALPQAN